MTSVSVSELNVRPFAHELVAQLKIVLDDAVVDDHYIAGAVRVGVLLGRRPMGRPAGMTDTDRAGQGFGLEELVKLVELADRLAGWQYGRS